MMQITKTTFDPDVGLKLEAISEEEFRGIPPSPFIIGLDLASGPDLTAVGIMGRQGGKTAMMMRSIHDFGLAIDLAPGVVSSADIAQIRLAEANRRIGPILDGALKALRVGQQRTTLMFWGHTEGWDRRRLKRELRRLAEGKPVHWLRKR